MIDITKRDAVLDRYMRDDNTLAWVDMLSMADRIVELEATIERQDRILAALREPSEAVVRAVEDWIGPSYTRHAQHTIRAAVEAAEREVDRG